MLQHETYATGRPVAQSMRKGGAAMVQLAKRDPMTVYVVLDGRPADRPGGGAGRRAGPGPGGGDGAAAQGDRASRRGRLKRFGAVRGSGRRLPTRSLTPADPPCVCPGPSRSPSCRAARRLRRHPTSERRSRRPPRRHDPGDQPRPISRSENLDLRRRFDAGPPRRHARQRPGQRLHRRGGRRGSGSGPPATTASFLQRVPLVSYAVDSTKATLRAGARPRWRRSRTTTLPADFAVPGPADRRARQVVYIGTEADSASLPVRATRSRARSCSSAARPGATRSARPTWARRAGSG